MDKSKVMELLASETVDIKFTKADGTERLLTCTLHKDKLPPSNGESTRAKNPDSQAGFDLINQGWRSFRWDSVIEVNGVAYG